MFNWIVCNVIQNVLLLSGLTKSLLVARVLAFDFSLTKSLMVTGVLAVEFSTLFVTNHFKQAPGK